MTAMREVVGRMPRLFNRSVAACMNASFEAATNSPMLKPIGSASIAKFFAMMAATFSVEVLVIGSTVSAWSRLFSRHYRLKLTKLYFEFVPNIGKYSKIYRRPD
jgi:hypothetical protein